MSDIHGPLGWCAEYAPKSDGCNFKEGDCLSSMSAFVGRLLDRGMGRPTDEDRAKILANADFMERQAAVLRKAVELAESGHNGHGREAGNDPLTKGMRRAARAKPDAGGTCNGGVCILGASKMVERGLSPEARLTQAIGSNELKRIIKAATQLEDNADDLRAAVAL